MIITVTPNPSVDATLELSSPLQPGSVLRVSSSQRSAGGKGFNVAHAVHRAGVPTQALFLAPESDPFIALCRDTGVPISPTFVDGRIRTNTAITEPDGTTTKLNESGPRISPAELTRFEEAVVAASDQADYFILAGSLPPGFPSDWYATAVQMIRKSNPECQIAVDTSDRPLEELARAFPNAAPDIIKPNAFELGQITGYDGEQLEEAAIHGNFSPALRAAQPLLEQAVHEILLTLGGAGAVLITNSGAWSATPPPVSVASTVGAGDCSLAGYLLAKSRSLPPAECLRLSVAYGCAAASLPGTEIPSPEIIDTANTIITPLALETP